MTTTLLLGDCRELLPKHVPLDSVDLVFADPPFNIGEKYIDYRDRLPEAEYLSFTSQWMSACVHALKPGGAFWVNIPDRWAPDIVNNARALGLTLVNWCIWHYRFGQCHRSKFISSKTHALYFSKGERKCWNWGAILEPSDRASTYKDSRTKSSQTPGLRVPFDVWYGPGFSRVQGNNHERVAGVPNQLPEGYLERVILSSTNPGDTVLDPFLGSGTSGAVAQRLGRSFIGTELSPATLELATARITRQAA